MANSTFSSIKYLGTLFLDFKAKEKSRDKIKKAIILKSILLVLTIAGLIIGLSITTEAEKEILRMFIIGWWIIPIFFKLIYSAMKSGQKEVDSHNVVTVNLDNGRISSRPSMVGYIILILLLIGAILLFAFASVVLTIIYIPLLIAQLIVHIKAFVESKEKPFENTKGTV